MLMGVVAPPALSYGLVWLAGLIKFKVYWDRYSWLLLNRWAIEVNQTHGAYVCALLRILLAIILFKLLERNLVRRSFAFQGGKD